MLFEDFIKLISKADKYYAKHTSSNGRKIGQRNYTYISLTLVNKMPPTMKNQIVVSKNDIPSNDNSLQYN